VEIIMKKKTTTSFSVSVVSFLVLDSTFMGCGASKQPEVPAIDVQKVCDAMSGKEESNFSTLKCSVATGTRTAPKN
jgi:hypothetical protein